MDPNISKFRLLRLPLLARENVLQTMEWFDIITISYCSKRFKLFVKSLKIKSERLHLNISLEVVLDLGVRRWPGLVFKFCENIYPLETPCRLGVHRSGRNFRITASNIGNWLKHFSAIFHCTTITLVFFEEFPYVENLQNTFRGFTINRLNIIGQEISAAYTITLMETFLPVQKFGLYNNPFPDQITLQKAIRDIKFDQLMFFTPVQINLSDILVLNAVDIEVWKCRMSENDVNVLFKVWKNGWNPKINYLFMKFLRNNFSDDYEEKILDGLGAVKNEDEKYFNGKYDMHEIPVKGGYNIKKCDGTNATILFDVYGRVVDIHFMIWN